VRLLHLSEVPLPLYCPVLLHREEVTSPKKTIKIKQYLSTSHFLVDNRYVVIKSSQTKTRHFTPETENVDFYDLLKKMI
jgi:hypothetical protein